MRHERPKEWYLTQITGVLLGLLQALVNTGLNLGRCLLFTKLDHLACYIYIHGDFSFEANLIWRCWLLGRVLAKRVGAGGVAMFQVHISFALTSQTLFYLSYKGWEQKVPCCICLTREWLLYKWRLDLPVPSASFFFCMMFFSDTNTMFALHMNTACSVCEAARCLLLGRLHLPPHLRIDTRRCRRYIMKHRVSCKSSTMVL